MLYNKPKAIFCVYFQLQLITPKNQSILTCLPRILFLFFSSFLTFFFSYQFWRRMTFPPSPPFSSLFQRRDKTAS